MKILLVNDDGYDAEGIKLLQKKLAKYGEVTIIAPKDHMSAKSCSLTIRDTITLHQEAERVYSLTGFPADCVSFGLLGFGEDFDLVVSGCNHGLNVAYDTLYSGTIGACLEALKNSKKAIAFSCPFNFDLVERYFDDIMKYIFDHELLSNTYFLSVNFPFGDRVDGIQLSTLSTRNDRTYYREINDHEYQIDRHLNDEQADVTSDVYLVEHHLVSITPLTGSVFNEAVYQQIKKRAKC